MNKESQILLIHGSELKLEREPWKKYRHVENQRPLEEYALNKPDGDSIECPISYEETPLSQTTLLTCCRNLISDTCYAQLRSNLCPFCANPRKTGYLFINTPFGNKLFIVYDPSEDTVGAMKTRIKQCTGITQTCKLKKERCSLDMKPDDALLRQLGVRNGQCLYFG